MMKKQLRRRSGASHGASDMQSGYGLSRYNAGELLEAYQKGKLYGELKDLASSLKEEDNDVLILYKFK